MLMLGVHRSAKLRAWVGGERRGVAAVSILSREPAVRAGVARAVELGGQKEVFSFGPEAKGVVPGGCTLPIGSSISTALLLSTGIMEAGSKGGSTLRALLLRTSTSEDVRHVAKTSP